MGSAPVTLPKLRYTSGRSSPRHQSPSAAGGVSAAGSRNLRTSSGFVPAGSSREAGQVVRYGDPRMASVTPGHTASIDGLASSVIARSVAARPIAARTCGIPSDSAAIAEAYSDGSRITTPGCHSSHAERMPGSAACTLSPPKISPTTMASASSGVAAVCTRPQVGPSRCSGGTTHGQNGYPACSTVSARSCGPAKRPSCPPRRAASMNGTSGLKCPAPRVVANRTRTMVETVTAHRCRSRVRPFVVRVNAAEPAARPKERRMKFMLLLWGDEAQRADMSEEDAAADMARWEEYTGQLVAAGAMAAGEALQPSLASKTLRIENGERVVT